MALREEPHFSVTFRHSYLTGELGWRRHFILVP